MTPCVDTTGFPEVSFCISTYNRAGLLPRCLQSILNEADHDAPSFEVVVVDDCSTDSTADVIELWAGRFAERNIVFKAFKRAECSGYHAAPKNAAIEAARGTYIRFFDDDNECVASSTRLLYDAIRSGDIWVDLIYGRRDYVLDPGCAAIHAATNKLLPIGPSPLFEHDPARLAAGPQFNYIDTGDFIVARGVFFWLNEHTGMMWNERRRRFGDWELVARMANLDKLVGAAPVKMRPLDAIVQRYHWVGSNLQLVRPAVETPEAVAASRLA